MGNKVIKDTSVKQGLYAISSTANGDIGSLMEFEDGRKFVYALNGSDTLLPGNFIQAPVEDSTNDVGIAIATSVAVGDKTIALTSARTYTVNELQDGWVIIDDETAAKMGHSRKIKSHAAVGTSGNVLTLNLYDAWTDTASAGTDTVTVIENPYNGVMLNNTSTDGTLLGVAVCDVTAANYFWLQVAGPAPAKVGNATDLKVGMDVMVTGTAGLILKAAGASDETVGRAMRDVGTAYDDTMIWLTMR